MNGTDAIFAPGFRDSPYWWEAAPPGASTAPLPDAAEVVIVGGGIAGLSTALELGRNGIKALVIDRETIGWGASSRNGGALSGAGSLGKVRADLKEAFGESLVNEMVEEGEAAYEDFAGLIARENLDCDFVRSGRFVGAHAPKAMEGLKRRAEMLNVATGAEEAFILPRGAVAEEIATAKYHGGMVMLRAGGLHPAKYVRSLAEAATRQGATLVSGVTLESYARQPDGSFVVTTDKGRISAKHLMLATNGYTGAATPWFRRRLIPVASYMIATEELGEERVRRALPKLRVYGDTKKILLLPPLAGPSPYPVRRPCQLRADRSQVGGGDAASLPGGSDPRSGRGAHHTWLEGQCRLRLRHDAACRHPGWRALCHGLQWQRRGRHDAFRPRRGAADPRRFQPRLRLRAAELSHEAALYRPSLVHAGGRHGLSTPRPAGWLARHEWRRLMQPVRKTLGRRTLARLLALGAMCLPLAAPAGAQTLTMATQSTFGIDPHFFFNGPNMAAARHIYDTVISRDENSRQVPGAVESWRAVEPQIWELKLRPGVTFHDGSPFTAEDIAFSIARIPNVPGNIGPYTINLRTIERVEIVDPLTVRLHTSEPNPLIPGQLTNVFVVSARAAANASTEDFNRGRAAIGTGP